MTQKIEPENKGPAWKHPWVLYGLIHIGILAAAIMAAVLAVKQGWIPLP